MRVVIAPDSGTANGVTKSKAGPRSQRELTVCSERPTRCARPPRGRMRKSSGLSSPYTLPPAARSISSAWYPVLALCAHGQPRYLRPPRRRFSFPQPPHLDPRIPTSHSRTRTSCAADTRWLEMHMRVRARCLTAPKTQLSPQQQTTTTTTGPR